MESLILRNDPDMDIVTKEYAFDETEITDLNENRINVAFVIEDYIKKETKGDPRYIKYVAQVWYENDDEIK